MFTPRYFRPKFVFFVGFIIIPAILWFRLIVVFFQALDYILFPQVLEASSLRLSSVSRIFSGRTTARATQDKQGLLNLLLPKPEGKEYSLKPEKKRRSYEWTQGESGHRRL
jgi:hypothetical protein